MRHFFSDTTYLKKRAKSNLKTNLGQLKHWWIKKYNLPPNHELFLSRSLADLNLEWFEDLVLAKKEVKEQLEDRDSQQDIGRLWQHLNNINKALGDELEVQDDLVDKWERELAEGKIPDLDER